MVYSKFFVQKDKQLPKVLFVIALLVIGIFVSLFFTQPKSAPHASRSTVRRVEITNLSPTQVTIFWQTPEKTVSSIVYGSSKTALTENVNDDRDLSDKKNPRLNHVATIHAISPNTTYFYKIIVDNKEVYDQGDKPFTLKTPANISASTKLGPAYGRILAANSQPVRDGIVLLSFPNTYPFVALTRDSGEWLIAYNGAIDKSTLLEKQLSQNDEATLEVYSETEDKTTIKADQSSLDPLPQTIVMGKDYSFKNQSNVLAATSEVDVNKPVNSIDVIYPIEGGIIPGSSPLIKGKGIPGNDVIVMIAAKTSYSYKAKVDSGGVWSIAVSNPLPAGQHTLTMTTNDKDSHQVVISRSFTIAKSGEQVLGDSTGSATPTVAPTTILTSTPTTFLLPTSTPAVVASSSATPAMLVSGGSSSVWTYVGGAFIVVGLGVLLAF